MIRKLFATGIEKAGGSQTALAEILKIPQQHISVFLNYKGVGRKPSEELILELANFLEWDKGETLYQAKLELEPEKAYLWEWCSKKNRNQDQDQDQ